MKGCKIFWGVKNRQTLAALWAGAFSYNKKKSREKKFCCRIRRTTVLGIFRDPAIILDAFDGDFWQNKQQQQQCLPQFESILDGHLFRHLLPAPFRLEIVNTTYKFLIGSEPHFHKPFTTIPVFLLQIDRLWNKILLRLSVNFRHPWHIEKTEFTRQVITSTLSKINKRNSVCERVFVMIVSGSGLADRLH
jgi:hypothetical protein